MGRNNKLLLFVLIIFFFFFLGNLVKLKLLKELTKKNAVKAKIMLRVQ